MSNSTMWYGNYVYTDVLIKYDVLCMQRCAVSNQNQDLVRHCPINTTGILILDDVKHLLTVAVEEI